jgi:hypothetical protein
MTEPCEKCANTQRWAETAVSNAHADYTEASKQMAAEVERLRRFVDFVNLWCWRDTQISDSERLSMIKHHPTAKAALPATRDMEASNG